MSSLHTWAEVVAVIAERWQVQSQTADLVTFGWPASGPPEEILQAVCAELGGRQRVLIGVNIASASSVSAQHALAMNSKRLFGSLMILNGTVVARETLTLGRFDAADLDEVVTALAQGAALCRMELTRPQAGSASEYVD